MSCVVRVITANVEPEHYDTRLVWAFTKIQATTQSKKNLSFSITMHAWTLDIWDRFAT